MRSKDRSAARRLASAPFFARQTGQYSPGASTESTALFSFSSAEARSTLYVVSRKIMERAAQGRMVYRLRYAFKMGSGMQMRMNSLAAAFSLASSRDAGSFSNFARTSSGAVCRSMSAGPHRSNSP